MNAANAISLSRPPYNDHAAFTAYATLICQTAAYKQLLKSFAQQGLVWCPEYNGWALPVVKLDPCGSTSKREDESLTLLTSGYTTTDGVSFTLSRGKDALIFGTNKKACLQVEAQKLKNRWPPFGLSKLIARWLGY